MDNNILRESKRTRILVLLLIIFSSQLIQQSLSAEPILYRFTEKVVYENQGSTPIILTEMDRSVSLFQNNSRQTVILVEISPAVERVFNDDANPYALLRIPERIEGHSNLTITSVYEIASTSYVGPELSKDQAQDHSKINQSLVAQYCSPSGTWLTEDTAIRVKAKEIAGNRTRVLDIVEALIIFFKSNVAYDGSSEMPKYPNETLSSSLGDCDDQSILLITMCRILGIPAYLQIGPVLRGDLSTNETVWDGHLKLHTEGVGWHGWAMVHIPPWGWLPVDLTYVTDREGSIPEIMHPGIYQDYIILQLSFSEFDYVGESRATRDNILNSSLNIYVEEKATKLGPSISPIPWELLLELLTAISIAAVLIYALQRTRLRRGHSF